MYFTLMSFLAMTFMAVPIQARREVVDSVKVVIYGETETIIITESETQRPGLDGQPKTLDDLIFEYLVFLDARRIGAVPDLSAMEQHWENVKKQNNLSEADMQQLAEQAGYTLPEAKEQLGKMSAISQMFDFKVRSGVFVTKQEVMRYDQEHPEFVPAEYEITRALIPFSDMESKKDMKKRLSRYAKGRGTVRCSWCDPFILLHDEIAEDKSYIYSMRPGQISEPSETPYGFELFKLVSKKPRRRVPLQERYDEIALELKRPKYEELMNKYKDELYDKATIVFY